MSSSYADSKEGAATDGSLASCQATPNLMQVPDRAGYSSLSSIDALSDSDMWATGIYYEVDDKYYQPTMNHWDGREWTTFDIDNPRYPYDQFNYVLNAVSMVATNDVWAVGRAMTETLVIHWDGAAWARIPSPNGSTAYNTNLLSGISVVEADDIWAVGQYTENNQAPSTKTLVMHWDGTEWSIVPSPNPSDYSNVLLTVEAVASDDVWAGGIANTYSLGYGAFIVHWDGVKWTQHKVKDLEEVIKITSISAISSNDIWAVGHSDTQYGLSIGYALHWDGAEWAAMKIPQSMPPIPTRINDVVAIGSNNVWAIGDIGSLGSIFSPVQQLTLHWDGSVWSEVPNTGEGKLSSVVATPEGKVWAAGSHDVPAETFFTRWDGLVWADKPAPSGSIASSSLNGIEAISPTNVWAVGRVETTFGGAYSYRVNLPLIQHWDGVAWTNVDNTLEAAKYGGDQVLYSISAVSPDDIWAVGVAGSYSAQILAPLAIHWNGIQWSYTDLPLVPYEDREFRAVKAFATDDVWAAGYQKPEAGATRPEPLVGHWDGEEWTYVAMPELDEAGGQLLDIDGSAPDDLWAVGHTGFPGDATTLVFHWDGIEWSRVESPNVEGNRTQLQSVAVSSSTNAWAVGTFGSYTGEPNKAFTMHWDGSAWTQVHAPSVDGHPSFLTAVETTGPDNARAVGNVWLDYPFSTSFTLVWNGEYWTYSNPEYPGTVTNFLWAISATSPTDVWIAGDYSSVSPSHASVQHVGRFSDVGPTAFYYEAVEFLLSRNAISGYDDCTFRPGELTTRAQFSKMVTLAAGWDLLDPAVPSFPDVPRDHHFYKYIETAYAHGVMPGPCGDPGSPCDPTNPFLPQAHVSRSQVARAMSIAAGWEPVPPGIPTFLDVPATYMNYPYIEAAAQRGILVGYPCGGPGEPCDAFNRPYFRPYAPATRGQIAKIIYKSLTTP